MNTRPVFAASLWLAAAALPAAAGAQGAEMSRLVPPIDDATSPIAVAPRMPASAP